MDEDDERDDPWWWNGDLPEPVAAEPDDNEYYLPVGSGVDAVMADSVDRWWRLGISGEDAPAQWEADLRRDPEQFARYFDPYSDVADLHLPDDEFEQLEPEPPRCGRCDDACATWDQQLRRYLCCCEVCGQAPRLIGRFPMCAQCQIDRLCRSCGLKPKRSKGRCDTCRKYFERNGAERPRHLITKNPVAITHAELQQTLKISAIRAANPYFEPRP